MISSLHCSILAQERNGLARQRTCARLIFSCRNERLQRDPEHHSLSHCTRIASPQSRDWMFRLTGLVSSQRIDRKMSVNPIAIPELWAAPLHTVSHVVPNALRSYASLCKY